jgi:hypothetical protein
VSQRQRSRVESERGEEGDERQSRKREEMRGRGQPGGAGTGEREDRGGPRTRD